MDKNAMAIKKPIFHKVSVILQSKSNPAINVLFVKSFDTKTLTQLL
jgi:hypothetical protein